MRFEAKHAYFKKLVRVTNNFKNLLSTLAERHQSFQVYLTLGEFGRSQVIKLSKANETVVENLSENIKTMLANSGLQISKPIHECRFVSLNGMKYYTEMVVVISFIETGPLFGKIEVIYVQSMEIRFFLRICNAEWEPHYGAYCISLTGEFRVLKTTALFDFYPLSIYEKLGKKFVVLKNFLFDERDFLSLS